MDKAVPISNKTHSILQRIQVKLFKQGQKLNTSQVIDIIANYHLRLMEQIEQSEKDYAEGKCQTLDEAFADLTEDKDSEEKPINHIEIACNELSKALVLDNHRYHHLRVTGVGMAKDSFRIYCERKVDVTRASRFMQDNYGDNRSYKGIKLEYVYTGKIIARGAKSGE